jgi:hypothetical protein
LAVALPRQVDLELDENGVRITDLRRDSENKETWVENRSTISKGIRPLPCVTNFKSRNYIPQFLRKEKRKMKIRK